MKNYGNDDKPLTSRNLQRIVIDDEGPEPQLTPEQRAERTRLLELWAAKNFAWAPKPSRMRLDPDDLLLRLTRYPLV